MRLHNSVESARTFQRNKVNKISWFLFRDFSISHRMKHFVSSNPRVKLKKTSCFSLNIANVRLCIFLVTFTFSEGRKLWKPRSFISCGPRTLYSSAGGFPSSLCALARAYPTTTAALPQETHISRFSCCSQLVFKGCLNRAENARLVFFFSIPLSHTR